MEKLISKTEEIAVDYLKGFGLKEEQIALLIMQGKKDLRKELKKLDTLLHDDKTSNDDLNNVLHSLTGLLFQLGNHDAANRLIEIKSHLEDKSTLNDIELLYR